MIRRQPGWSIGVTAAMVAAMTGCSSEQRARMASPKKMESSPLPASHSSIDPAIGPRSHQSNLSDFNPPIPGQRNVSLPPPVNGTRVPPAPGVAGTNAMPYAMPSGTAGLGAAGTGANAAAAGPGAMVPGAQSGAAAAMLAGGSRTSSLASGGAVRSQPGVPRDFETTKLPSSSEFGAEESSGGVRLASFWQRITGNRDDDAKAWVNHTQGIPFVIGYRQGLSESQATRKPMMLFFTTSHCTWCEKLARDCFRDDEVQKTLQNFVCVIVDGNREREVAQQFGVTKYPHLVFQSSAGLTLATSTGYVDVAKMRDLLRQASAGSAVVTR